MDGLLTAWDQGPMSGPDSGALNCEMYRLGRNVRLGYVPNAIISPQPIHFTGARRGTGVRAGPVDRPGTP